MRQIEAPKYCIVVISISNSERSSIMLYTMAKYEKIATVAGLMLWFMHVVKLSSKNTAEL